MCVCVCVCVCVRELDVSFPAPVAAGIMPNVIGLGVVVVIRVALTRGRLGYRPEATGAMMPDIS